MSRFSKIKLHPLDKKDPDNAEILAEQKTLKLKDSSGRDISVGSKVKLPNPEEEGQVVFIDDEDVIVRMAPPLRKGPASEVTCIRKCGRKPAAPKPVKPAKEPKEKSTRKRVRFNNNSPPKSRGRTRKANKHNKNNTERLAFLLKALKLHNASKSAKTAKTAKTVRKSRARSEND
jgi:hypothetical protein